MTNSFIRKKCSEIKSKYKENDIFVLAEKMGIKVYFRENFIKLRGMYSVILKNRFIFINANLSEYEQKITLAHEIGHDVLHREFAQNKALGDKMIIDMKLKPEYEANLFAADLLIDDKEVKEAAISGYDVFQAASILGTDPNLLSLKIKMLKETGEALNDVDYDPDFLK